MKITPANEAIDLRRGIDHIGVSVVSIIHDGKGRILLMKRGKKARDEHGCWDICGGALEFGESIDEAIRREVMEELCTEALDIVFLNAGDAHRTNHDDMKTHWVWLLHSVLVNPKTVKIGEPHKIDEIGWFNMRNLPSPLHSQFHNALKGAKQAGIIR
jgi:ADP-ribose pyrophosphatase YjhB (NUDIX family)